MVSKVPLGEVCDFVRGVSFDGDAAIDVSREGYVPILRAGNIGDELYIHDDLVWVPEKRVSKEQYFQVGDIAICMASGSPAVLGKTAQLKESFIGSVGAFCGIIRPTKADPNYIAYWLKSPTFMAWRDSQANGVNIQNLRPNEVREIEIPLPPLTEQKRIASLLARADRLRHLRRTAHDLGDALLQSVFLEMFGNPLVNNKGWKVRTLRSVSSKFSDGPFGSDLKSEHYVSEGVRVIRLQNIGIGNLIDNDQAYISEEHFAELSKHQCLPGDVIVGTLGDPNLRAMILPDSIPQALNKADCVQIRVNPKICNNQFICWLVNMPQTLQLASGMIHGQTRARINMGRLAELEVPIPPLSLQEEFAGVVARVESLRGRMGESTRQVEGLFESLLETSFKGNR